MRYWGSEAIDLDMQEASEPTYGRAPYDQAPDPAYGRASVPVRRARRPLVVVEGGHLDADARQAVSPQFLTRARLVIVAVVVFCALGALRVALTSATVTLMSENLTLASHIDEASSLNDELHAERSLLSSSHRIVTIATENYGMVYAPTQGTAESTQGSDSTSADPAQDAS